MKTVFACAVFCFLCWFGAPRVQASEFRGSVEIQAPVETPDRFVDNSPMAVGRLQLPNFLGPLSFGFEVRHQLRENFAFHVEDRFIATVECPLGDGVTLFSFFERRYATDQERVVAGIRFPFRGRF